MQAVIISLPHSIPHCYVEQYSNAYMSYGLGSTYIEFEDVIVPADNLLGGEGQGFEIIMSSA